MAGSNHGALGATYKIARALQICSLIAIIGMTANFVGEMVSAGAVPPPVLVGTLSIVSIAVLYCGVTVILFLDNLLPYLINTAIDCFFLIALIVVSVVVGKPVSYLSCKALADMSTTTSNAYDFTTALGSSLNDSAGKIDYSKWIGTSTPTCLEVKSIWGLSIALCILFTLSAICSVFLWKRSKRGTPEKAEV